VINLSRYYRLARTLSCRQPPEIRLRGMPLTRAMGDPILTRFFASQQPLLQCLACGRTYVSWKQLLRLWVASILCLFVALLHIGEWRRLHEAGSLSNNGTNGKDSESKNYRLLCSEGLIGPAVVVCPFLYSLLKYARRFLIASLRQIFRRP
jgi:hypothetical protein